MRTKALLLAAAFAAAGVATSMAQVYSVNAVGYVNVSITPGFNMVSNPLDAADNKIGSLFKNITPSIPGGLKVFAFNPTSGAFYPSANWSSLDEVFNPQASSDLVVAPGEGVFIFDPRVAGSAPLTLTFVGQVPQGTLNNPLPLGFSIKANQVPQAGSPQSFGLPAEGGDKVFRFNKTTQAYDTYTYSSLDAEWQRNGTAGLPSIGVGEAWFHFRSKTAGTWTRNFSVNNPT